MTPMLAKSVLARSVPATAVQATFEPEEDEPEDEEPGEPEDEEPDEEDEDDELPTLSPDFLSLAADLSPDEDVSDFLPSDDPFDPLAEAAAVSLLFWLARLSVR
jgi:hypothetical protein